jgi:membrane associated rhomboid family serine protease
MMPYRDDAPIRGAPVAVALLIATNVAAFLFVLSLDAEDAATLFDRWALVPREFLRGAVHPAATRQMTWLTPVSSMFLHASPLHLAGNMLALWIFGSAVEDLLGRTRFLVFYLACGLAAAAIQIASEPTAYVATVGASGAISGLLGAYAVSYPSARLRLAVPPMRVPALLFLTLWIAIQVASGVQSRNETDVRIAWWAHVGGFLAGVSLARAMWVRKPTHSRLRI